MNKSRVSKKSLIGGVIAIASLLSMNVYADREQGVDPEPSAKSVAPPSKLQQYVCEVTGLWCPE